LILPEGFGAESDPREIDASDRYALAVTSYQWRGKSDEALAWLYLRSSWVARDFGAMLPPEPRMARVMSYTERWRPLMGPDGNQYDVEMGLATRVAEAIAAGEFNRYQKPYVELALLLILRRHGENRQAEPLLSRLSGKAFSDPMRESLDRMSGSIAAERRFQARAADHFERALLSDQITPANRGAACYLLGELHRRLNRDSSAIRWYDRALGDRALPPNLRDWAIQQKQWCLASQSP
jgi:hypothetical protein